MQRDEHVRRGLLCLASLVLATPTYADALKVGPGRGVVAADSVEASRAGAEILAHGGDAVDAAVGTALALGVVSPMSSGLGGGGFLVVWRAKEKKAFVLDFREVAPAAATPNMFVNTDAQGRSVADPFASKLGGRAVAVPGEPAGLAAAHARFGKLSWYAVVQPALKLARDGFLVNRAHVEGAARARTKLQPPAGDLLLPLLQVADGDHLTRPDLALSLDRLAKLGGDEMYKGLLAHVLVDGVRRRGGALTLDDLAAYKPVWREPLVGAFRGRQLWAAPPPAGGLTTIESLQILDTFPAVVSSDDELSTHRLAEALKHAFADRARLLGDPAFVDVPTATMVAPEYAKNLASHIDGKTGHPASYGGKLHAPAAAPRDGGTSHLCVVDAEGNVAALTSTVNLLFGAGFVAAGTVMNNQMDDFSILPAAPNAFGLVGSQANAIAAGKRPLSSMTPMVITLDGKPILCAGASGGPLIVTSTVQTIVNFVDHQLPLADAVAAPRLHAQWMPDKLFLETKFSDVIRTQLAHRGHHLAALVERGVEQAIAIFPDHLEAVSDLRKGGVPVAPERVGR